MSAGLGCDDAPPRLHHLNKLANAQMESELQAAESKASAASCGTPAQMGAYQQLRKARSLAGLWLFWPLAEWSPMNTGNPTPLLAGVCCLCGAWPE